MINLSKLAAVARAKPKTKVAPTSSANADQEKLSRRAALRRIGMTGGIAVLGLLTIDDLARVAAKKLDQNALTHGIAKDFKNAGVAFAGPSLRSICEMGCDNQYTTDMDACGSEPVAGWNYAYYLGQVVAWNICRGQAHSDRTSCNDGCTSLGTD